MRLGLRPPRYYIRRARHWLTVPIVPATVEVVKPEPLALAEARWNLRVALDDVPRDQEKVNRLRRQVEALSQPEGLHRHGNVR